MTFYFTGTGNSLYAAKKLDRETVSIPQIMKSEALNFKSDKIGIVCPVYGHEMPAMVKEFIRRAVFDTDYLFLILTYGFRHANAVGLAEKVLSDCGKQAAYIKTLLTVDNFLPGFDMTAETATDKKVEEQLSGILSDISRKKRDIEAVTPEDARERKRYLAMVKNRPETVWANFTVTDECVGCGICTRVCPSGGIYLEDQKAIHTDKNCQACFACIHACPKTAIRLNIPEKNPNARYRNEHITLRELVAANDQTGSKCRKGYASALVKINL